MSFTKNIQAITLSTLDELEQANTKIKELQAEKANYYKPRYDELMNEAIANRESIISNGRNKISEEISNFKAETKEKYAPKGEELTADAALLNSGINLTATEIDNLMEKYADNNTMKRLLHEYSEKNNLNIQRKYISEEAKNTAADGMMNYFNSVMQRPEYSDLWRNEERYESNIAEELKGE